MLKIRELTEYAVAVCFSVSMHAELEVNAQLMSEFILHSQESEYTIEHAKTLFKMIVY